MKGKEFRDLDIELPRQKLVDQRPWWIAGILLAVLVILLATVGYLQRQKAPQVTNTGMNSAVKPG